MTRRAATYTRVSTEENACGTIKIAKLRRCSSTPERGNPLWRWIAWKRVPLSSVFVPGAKRAKLKARSALRKTPVMLADLSDGAGTASEYMTDNGGRIQRTGLRKLSGTERSERLNHRKRVTKPNVVIRNTPRSVGPRDANTVQLIAQRKLPSAWNGQEKTRYAKKILLRENAPGNMVFSLGKLTYSAFLTRMAGLATSASNQLMASRHSLLTIFSPLLLAVATPRAI